jgi:hypothetical protein
MDHQHRYRVVRLVSGRTTYRERWAVEKMRTIATLASDTLVALALFVAGQVALGVLRGPLWLVPLSMLPFFAWLTYQGAFHRRLFPFVIWSTVGFTVALFVITTGVL